MRISLLPIAIVLLLSFSVHDDAAAAPQCRYLGGISQDQEFDKVFGNPFFSVIYEDVASMMVFNKLNKCEVAAGILVFFRKEKVPASEQTLSVTNYILVELLKLPPNHLYLKVLREADGGKSLEDRVIKTAGFFGGVVNAIPAMQDVLHAPSETN